jgi:hypothetical protein
VLISTRKCWESICVSPLKTTSFSSNAAIVRLRSFFPFLETPGNGEVRLAGVGVDDRYVRHTLEVLGRVVESGEGR